MRNWAGLTPDGLAQVLATVVTAILAVVGAIYGSRAGAKATIDAATGELQRTIEADRKVRTERWKEDKALALTTLSQELRWNWARVEQKLMNFEGVWIHFEHSAMDNARPYLFDLPTPVYQALTLAAFAITRYNTWVNFVNSREPDQVRSTAALALGGIPNSSRQQTLTDLAKEGAEFQYEAAEVLWEYMQQFTTDLADEQEQES